MRWMTDQKRFVRGEHLLLARSRLRISAHAHNKRWRVLLLAGPKPSEEMSAVRCLMPKAHITALDTVDDHLDSARAAGADAVLSCNLLDGEVNECVQRDGKFDLVVLDLCTIPCPTTLRLRSAGRNIVAAQGVMIFNFSYGRDVREVFENLSACEEHECLEEIALAGASNSLRGRLAYLFPSGYLDKLISIMIYRGHAMPVCSTLFHFATQKYLPPVSFVAAEPGDFELAVTCPDPALLYACPQERIEALRRSNPAIKAHYTRKNSSR